jgi:hypothetical protein
MSIFSDEATPKDTDELYHLNVSKYIGKEYLPFLEDIARMFTIQVVLQLMLFAQSPSANPFFDVRFIEALLYILLGVSVYWLVLKKLVKLT